MTYNIQTAQPSGTHAKKGPWGFISGLGEEATNP